jgi:dTDP-4-dehydrorhamnose 3,5-epimerase
MRVHRLDLPGVLLIEPKVFGDERGCFFESYNRDELRRAAGITQEFVQDNRSVSQQGVLRGLHFQRQQPQGKLITVLSGEVFDVAVDIRRSSPTFGEWVSATLSARNRHQMWVPQGFAHGFLVLSESAEVFYKTTDFYAPADQHAIAWNDPQIGIAWPALAGVGLQMSQRDREAQPLRAAHVFE